MTKHRMGALLIVLLLVGCVRHHERAATPPVGSQSEPAPPSGSQRPQSVPPVRGVPAAHNPAALVLQPVPPPSRLAAGQRVASALPGTDGLLPLTVEAPVYPTDYVIGPLQPFPSADAAVDAIYTLTEKFTSELARGTIDSSLLSPRWRETVERFLSYPKEHGMLPDGVRIGKVSVQESDASAPVRFARGAGRTRGTLYFDRVDGKWYLSDIQADFGKLVQPFVRSEPYEPTSWQWLLSK